MQIGVFFGIAAFLGGLVLAVPIGWLFIGATGVGLTAGNMPATFIMGTLYHALNSDVLMAIGFFVFAGSLISEGGLADRIVAFSQILVGRIRGGLILVGIIATVFMSALTGSSIPCLSALAPLLVPRLEKVGYKREYTTGVLCSASFLGYLIPPSVPGLIYCLLAQQSVAAVFLSTVIPGLILASGYAVLNYFISDKYCDKELLAKSPGLAPFKERLQVFPKVTWQALPALGCPIVILVGIYGGLCTPNEAGALAAVYCMLVGFFIYKGLNRKTLRNALMVSVISVGVIGLMVAGGTLFGRFLVRTGAAQEFAGFLLGLFESKAMILLSMNVLILIMGMFIEAIPILIIGVPLVLPLMSTLDVNLVHLGSIFIVNVGLGVITPPFAMSLFVGSRLGETSYQSLVPVVLKYLFFVGIPTLMLTTYIPALSCWLPEVLLGSQVVGAW